MISRLIVARERDLGGFTVRRVLPIAGGQMVGPWIFFDHLGPVDFEPGQGIDVRPHPHIHLATVTYLFEGELLHRDSLGSVQTIRPGEINLMVAGRGIVHSERERPEVRVVSHRLHALQLWQALPDGQEDIAPSFHHHEADAMPVFVRDDAECRLLIGSAWSQRSPVPVFGGALYVEAHLPRGGMLNLPSVAQAAVYVVHGTLQLGVTMLTSGQMGVLASPSDTRVQARTDSHFVLIGGEPCGPRLIDWNFVSSRREAIDQARDDWQHRRFDNVPGDEADFIPLPA